MSVVGGMTGRLVAVLTGTLVAVGLLVAGPARAEEPWWHLSSKSRPSYLKPGSAVNEIQRLTISAVEGIYQVDRPSQVEGAEGETALLEVGEEPGLVQETLEELYGKGNVRVTSSIGEGYNLNEVYEIEFVGALADQSQALLGVPRERLTGGKETATVTDVRKGRPDGVIIVTASNIGDANVNPAITPVELVDHLPKGLEAVGVEGFIDETVTAPAAENFIKCAIKSTVGCEYLGVSEVAQLAPFEQLQMRIDVKVAAGAVTGEVNEAEINGGNAPPARAESKLVVSDQPVPFEAIDLEMRPEEEGGSTDSQAGSHPFQLTTTVRFNETFNSNPILGRPAGMTKDLHFALPAGLVGNPSPIPKCSLANFLASSNGGDNCMAEAAIGVAKVVVNVPGLTGGKVAPIPVPLFNLEPATGEPARFGFLVYGIPVILDTAVRTGGDYGVTVSVTNITQTAGFLESEVTFWGVPGDPRHNAQRGWKCLNRAGGCQPLEEVHPPPFLSLPTSCTGPLQTSVEADSWQEPFTTQTLGNTLAMPAMDGCNRLQFEPSVSVAPDSQAGSTPTGLAVKVSVPQDVSLDAGGLAEADVKNTTVALPAGVAINPAGADGLQACSEEQIGLKNAEIPTCPSASKVGLVKIKTPLLPNELEGAAYLAAQNANPFGSLVALYVYVEDPVSGTRVKLAGEVAPNPVTGQLVSTFKNTPQLPFETFELHFFGGDRAPLASPAYCGAYTSTAAIEPWTGSGEVDSSSTFDITSGPASFDEPAGRACPNGHLPFDPSLTGGATNIDAGAFSPLTLTFSRKDGEQNIQSAEAHLPPGLSGILSNIELCPEPQANLGECPANSLIGETTVSVGVGGDPFTVGGGKFYLTGPYNGTGSCTVGTPGCAPFGITFDVPAKAGPFDLKRNTANPAGEDPCDCVIVRGKIEVNPITAAITIKSDPPGSPYAIPTSIDGIPLEIQHINATTTRGNFQFNPTNCEKMQVTGAIHSSESTTFAVSVPFQVTNCAILAFKPGFKVSTSGKTSRKNGASLNVKLTYPKAPFGSQANIKSVKVDLPKQLPSRLTTLQKACTAAQFEANPAGCPADSIVGHGTAITPLIPVPLTGPAYFVSYGGAKFPELVIALQGYGVTLDLHGETFINKAGITSSTFHTVPDAPVGSFELNLPEGKYSALAANGKLCQIKLAMPTAFTAQNGATIKQSTPITVTGCPKHKATKKAKKKAGGKGKTHGKKK
ncbi:MAG TPA: hypothetical protein VIJ39_09060 [Solirubrobacteraceae bacterium]